MAEDHPLPNPVIAGGEHATGGTDLGICEGLIGVARDQVPQAGCIGTPDQPHALSVSQPAT
jgi:hypothetical protein